MFQPKHKNKFKKMTFEFYMGVACVLLVAFFVFYLRPKNFSYYPITNYKHLMDQVNENIYAQEYEQAIEILNKALSIIPKSDLWKLYLKKAQLYNYTELEDPDSAIFNADQAIKLNSNCDLCYEAISIAYFHKKDYKNAITSINKALEINQNNKQYIINKINFENALNAKMY